MRLRLLGVLMLLVGIIGTAGSYAAYAAPAPQLDDDVTYEPPYEPSYEPPSGSPEPSGGGAGGPNDGRVSYLPDEYFTLYCADDNLYIWRGIPTGLFLETFSLSSLVALPVGASISRGSNTIFHVNADTYNVIGTNGNLAPAPGEKSFSIAECLDRNGGTPSISPTATPAAGGTGSVVIPTPGPTAEIVETEADRTPVNVLAIACLNAFAGITGGAMVFGSFARPQWKKSK